MYACFVLCLQMNEFYERMSGARMHAAYIRPGGVSQVNNIKFFIIDSYERASDVLLLWSQKYCLYSNFAFKNMSHNMRKIMHEHDQSAHLCSLICLHCIALDTLVF